MANCIIRLIYFFTVTKHICALCWSLQISAMWQPLRTRSAASVRWLIAAASLTKIVLGQSQRPPSAIACSVLLEGNGPAGPQKASIRCRGGTIRAAADDPGVLRTLKGNSSGVAWQADNCGIDPGLCMLVICGASSARAAPLQIKLAVHGVQDCTQMRWGAVCIAGTTAVLQVGPAPQHCQARPVAQLSDNSRWASR